MTQTRKTDEKGQELKILHEIAKDISDDLDLNQLLKSIVDTVIHFVNVDSCLIYLYDRSNDELVLTVSNDPEIKNPGPFRGLGSILRRDGDPPPAGNLSPSEVSRVPPPQGR